ncbi:MAG: DUF6950 family protein [Tabrizicola sp.]
MTPMTQPPRRPDWRSRLNAYLAEIAPADFSYGSNDCALFVAGAVRALTGHDPAAAWRGTYTTLEGGLKRLKKAGIADHVAVVDGLFQRVAPAFAQVGDVALLRAESSEGLGIVVGETVVCLSPRGLAHLPRNFIIAAWTVP